MTTSHGVDRSGGGSGTGTPTPSPFVQTLLDDATAVEFLTTLGLDVDLLTLSLPSSTSISAFIKGLLDDADAATARATLDVPSNAEAVLDTLGDALGDTVVWTAADAPMRAGFSPWFGNYSLTATVSSNALTIALKGTDGNDPSSSNPVFVAFRNATITTGTPAMLAATASNSLVISSGSTLGSANSTPFRFWIVAFNDGGTLRLGAINCFMTDGIFSLSQYQVLSSTAEGGAGAADTAGVVYTGTAVSSKAFAILGFVEYSSGLATAGTYASAPTKVQLFGPGIATPGQVVQERFNSTGAYATGTTQIPSDDTIPQITEGDQYMTQAITPISAANLLVIDATWVGSPGVSSQFGVCLFQDATANALAAVLTQGDDESFRTMPLRHVMRAGTGSSTTFRIRMGANGAGTSEFNGRTGGRVYGGVLASHIKVSEIQA